MKRLFDDNHQYINDAIEIDKKISKYIDEILNDNKNADISDLTTILYEVVSERISRFVLFKWTNK